MQVGLDVLAGGEPAIRPLLKRLRAGRVGLLAHAASVDRGFRHAVDVLVGLGVTPVTLFGPEHGFGGAAQDMIGVDDAVDPRTGARVVSLYGEEEADLVPTAADLEPLDVLVIDLVDVGARYYTYVWTALIAAREAAKVDTHVVFLDRPNPIGDGLEGRTVDEGFTSFVGYEPVPIRHGLTLAGMAVLHLSSEGVALGSDGAASVVALRDVMPSALASDWDRPFVLPSPNMPTFDTALVYPGGCLLEGTNLSEGRGHTRPFEIWGAPWLDGRRLAEGLADLGLPGVIARPLSFIPTFHKHGGEVCGGVQVHVTESPRLPTRGHLRRAHRARPPPRIQRSSGSGPSGTSTSTTSPPSICSPARPRRARRSKRWRRPETSPRRCPSSIRNGLSAGPTPRSSSGRRHGEQVVSGAIGAKFHWLRSMAS